MRVPVPFKRRWLLTTIFVLFASVVMVRLGFWQLDRLAQKRAYINDALAEINGAPIAITGDETTLDALDMNFRPATVTGEFDFEHEVLIKNQTYRDQPGFDILTPMRIAGSERAVLVDRGWLPYDVAQTADLSDFREAGVTIVAGRIAPGEARPAGAILPPGPQSEWYRVDIPGIQDQTPYELLPFYVAMTVERDTLPYRNPPEPILDEGPHLGYAIQWFLFALVVPIAYVWQVRKFDRKPETETPDEDESH